MTKIIFFDIDGTLVDMERKVISTKTLETLQRLKENNILLVISTGRAPVSLPDFKDHFDAFSTFNGSYCFNNKETILTNPIPKKDVQTLIHNATMMHKPVAISTKDILVANGDRDPDLAEYFSFSKSKINVSLEFEEFAKQDVYQVMMSGRKEQYPEILKNIKQAKIAAWWDRAVDIIPSTSGKGIAVNHILDYYNINKSESLAFGDGNNDIEMLEAVGTGVAMKNASNELKAIADDICGDVKDDGIYHYCLEHHLI